MLKWLKRFTCKHEVILLKLTSIFAENTVKEYVCYNCGKEIIKVERR